MIDNRQVIATTANFTLSDIHGDLGRPDTRGNANSLLVIDSPAVARLFTEEFNIMWGGWSWWSVQQSLWCEKASAFTPAGSGGRCHGHGALFTYPVLYALVSLHQWPHRGNPQPQSPKD